jgi:hypothetical protein
MNDKIRARLDSVCGDAFVIWPYANILGDALRAVLDLCDSLDHPAPLHGQTDADLATDHHFAAEFRRAIADALGVEKLDPIIVAINADKMNPYRHG